MVVSARIIKEMKAAGWTDKLLTDHGYVSKTKGKIMSKRTKMPAVRPPEALECEMTPLDTVMFEKLVWLRDHYKHGLNPVVSKADRLAILSDVDDFIKRTVLGRKIKIETTIIPPDLKGTVEIK